MSQRLYQWVANERNSQMGRRIGELTSWQTISLVVVVAAVGERWRRPSLEWVKSLTLANGEPGAEERIISIDRQ